ncbi:hypothetical protein [Streptomyces sp. NPDC059176]|uniref:hypothetical protein n=1 Tax=unclassified Streptomyces TaxID=2593676 RepID=UPI0036A7BEAD
MRRRIVAALSAGVAGLALGVLPATSAFAASDTRTDYRCSDWRDGRNCDRGYYNSYYNNFNRFDRNFNDVVIILVAVR